jgi:hypothetical protein
VRPTDAKSIRAEQQARDLTRQTGQQFETEIFGEFGDTLSAKDYQTDLIAFATLVRSHPRMPLSLSTEIMWRVGRWPIGDVDWIVVRCRRSGTRKELATT